VLKGLTIFRIHHFRLRTAVPVLRRLLYHLAVIMAKPCQGPAGLDMACPHGAPRPPGKGGRFAQRCVDCAPLYVKFRKSNTDAALWKERKKRKQVHTEVPDPVQERRDSVQVFRDPDNTHDDDDDTAPVSAETGGGEDCACLKYVKEASGSAAAAAGAPQFVWRRGWPCVAVRGRAARRGWLAARGGRAGRGGRQGREPQPPETATQDGFKEISNIVPICVKRLPRLLF